MPNSNFKGSNCNQKAYAMNLPRRNFYDAYQMQWKGESWKSKKKKKKLTQGTLQVKGSHTTADFHIIHLSDLKNEMQIA